MSSFGLGLRLRGRLVSSRPLLQSELTSVMTRQSHLCPSSWICRPVGSRNRIPIFIIPARATVITTVELHNMARGSRRPFPAGSKACPFNFQPRRHPHPNLDTPDRDGHVGHDGPVVGEEDAVVEAVGLDGDAQHLHAGGLGLPGEEEVDPLAGLGPLPARREAGEGQLVPVARPRGRQVPQVHHARRHVAVRQLLRRAVEVAPEEDGRRWGGGRRIPGQGVDPLLRQPRQQLGRLLARPYPAVVQVGAHDDDADAAALLPRRRRLRPRDEVPHGDDPGYDGVPAERPDGVRVFGEPVSRRPLHPPHRGLVQDRRRLARLGAVVAASPDVRPPPGPAAAAAAVQPGQHVFQLEVQRLLEADEGAAGRRCAASAAAVLLLALRPRARRKDKRPGGGGRRQVAQLRADPRAPLRPRPLPVPQPAGRVPDVEGDDAEREELRRRRGGGGCGSGLVGGRRGRHGCFVVGIMAWLNLYILCLSHAPLPVRFSYMSLLLLVLLTPEACSRLSAAWVISHALITRPRVFIVYRSGCPGRVRRL